jgi:6-phosphogluconolactonase
MPAAAGGDHVHVFADLDALTAAAARRFVEDAREAIAARGRFIVCISGGDTPRPLYERLAHFSHGDATSDVAWSRVHVFWADERCVPPDDERSNYRMAREAWLEHVAIPADHVHRLRGEIDPRAAAAEYDIELHAFAGADLVLLGLGEDGHTASLFPHSPAVVERREDVARDRWVRAEHVASVAMWRLTLTPAVINRARDVVFLVAGARKAARVKEVIEGPPAPDALPAQAIRPDDGRLSWFLDEAAAGLLRGRRPTNPPA